MAGDRRTLNCARYFAVAALIFFFLASCTNYWLHAVTCLHENDTVVVKMRDELEGLQGYLLEPNNTNGQKSGTVSPTTTVGIDILNGSVKSSGKYEYQRRYVNYLLDLTLLSLKDFSRLSYQHEGFFWSCSFIDRKDKNLLSKFIYFYQPHRKCCTQAFQSPFPSKEGISLAEFQSNLVYHQLWSVLMFLGVVFITIGFLGIIFKTCHLNCCKNKTVGTIFLLAGVSFLISIIMYVLWMSAVIEMMAKKIKVCNSMGNKRNYGVNFGVNYGWSFIAAPFGILFSFIAGSLFIKISGNDGKESEGMI
ncbi:transmembrane protein 182-like [Narcine bancroftii]|uniref:transmembrane protein 182-like n=1 Tax=Narcine bancroftii TaxID=1343680 RepID=UPI0038321DCB